MIIPRPVYGRPAIDPDLYRSVKIMAAEQSTSMKSLTERLIRLGMVAPELALVIRGAMHSDNDATAVIAVLMYASEALAAYDAALEEIHENR